MQQFQNESLFLVVGASEMVQACDKSDHWRWVDPPNAAAWTSKRQLSLHPVQKKVDARNESRDTSETKLKTWQFCQPLQAYSSGWNN